MKKIFTLVVLSIFSIAIWAQSPNKLSYQAVVRDSDGNLIKDQAVGMQISILQGSATGTAVYTETHTPTTNANGLVSIEIGDGATTDAFSVIDWTSGVFFIKTEIDPDGSTSYSIESTSQLLSVPYAKYADKAGNVFSGSYNDLTDVPANMDTDATDDFSGDYADLTGTPTNVSEFTNDAGYLTEITGTETAFDGWDKDEDPWVVSSSDIYYNDGNVAIGTSDPVNRPLTIYKNDYSFLEFITATSGNLTTDGFVVGINDSKTAYMRNYEDGPIILTSTSGYNLYISNEGDVGIGTDSPDAKLDVNGDAKFGTNGVVFSEMREITGTTSSTSYFNYIALPTGYTEDNTRVLSVEINFSGTLWSGLGNDNGTYDRSTSYVLSSDRIYLYYPQEAQYQNRAFRVLIMKIAE